MSEEYDDSDFIASVLSQRDDFVVMDEEKVLDQTVSNSALSTKNFTESVKTSNVKISNWHFKKSNEKIVNEFNTEPAIIVNTGNANAQKFSKVLTSPLRKTKRKSTAIRWFWRSTVTTLIISPTVLGVMVLLNIERMKQSLGDFITVIKNQTIQTQIDKADPNSSVAQTYKDIIFLNDNEYAIIASLFAVSALFALLVVGLRIRKSVKNEREEEKITNVKRISDKPTKLFVEKDV